MNAEPAAGLQRTLVSAGQQVTVRVPATSANLGPGFDSLGLAVALHDTVSVETTDTGTITVEVAGEGAQDVPRDSSHLIVRTVLDLLEEQGFAVDGLTLRAVNVIPHGRGLGSSASAIVTGVLAANALLPTEFRLNAAAVLQRCSALEGHPDNVAPALSGALAISWEEEGRYFSTHVSVHPDVIPVVAVPAVELSTESARALLPDSVSHHTAAANSGRAALLIHAMTGSPDLLFEGTEDRLHQNYRAEAMAPSAALMGYLRARRLASFISGAGPTVMTLARGVEQAAVVHAAIQEHLTQTGSVEDWRVLNLNVDTEGARVVMHPRY